MKVFTTSRFFFSLTLSLLFFFAATAQTPNVVLTAGSGTWRPAPGIRSFHVFTWGGGAGGSVAFERTVFVVIPIVSLLMVWVGSGIGAI